MDGTTVTADSPAYPARLRALLGADAPARVCLAGPPALLAGRSLSLFCSVRCPGAMILQTYECMRRLRLRDVSVLSGYHAPMERECLRTLASGRAGIVWCLAKSLASFRLPAEWEPLLHEGRLLLLSPFADDVTRITAATSQYRNRVAAALADDAFLPYAAPGGRTEAFCFDLLAWEKTVFTLDAAENTGILERGARALTMSELDSFWPATDDAPLPGGLL